MKTKHRIVPVALLSSLALATGLAFAAGPEYPTNPERSFTTQSAPSSKTRAEVRAESRQAPATSDGWKDVGGERGAVLVQHEYKFVDGRFVHVDNLEHHAAKPSRIATADEQKMASLNYKNAP